MNRLPVGTAPCAGHIRPRHHQHSGVSLLEVMFSIGVVMIGLVGIGALIPLGGALARRGAVADAAAQMGANAAREFGARGMAIPNNWRWFDGANFTTVTVPGTYFPQPGMSFCLDPYFIGQADPAGANYANEVAARNQFPLNIIYDPALLAMPRITLPSSFTPNGVLAPTVAKQLFVGADDLTFDQPADRTLGPVQLFTFQNAAPANPLNRTSRGNISWMATIVPKLDRVRNSTTGMNAASDEYTLSIIVLARRPVDLFDPLTGNPNLEDEVGERVVEAAVFYSGLPAFSGGDITLAARSTRNGDDLEVRSGDWLMFYGEKTTKRFLPQIQEPYRFTSGIAL